MVDSVVTAIARGQYGLFSRIQVLAAGGDDKLISRRLQFGRWLRLAPGVYSLPGWPDSWRRSLCAAHLDVGLYSVVSHEAAAAIHGLPLFPPNAIVLTVPHGDHERTRRGVRVHQSTDLRSSHVTTIDGLPVTTVARTLFDLAAVVGRERLARSLDEAHVSRLCPISEVQGLYDALRRPGKRGMKRLAQLLAVRGPGYVPPESVLEWRLHKVLDDPRLPKPRRQFHVPWRSAAEQRVDLAFPEAHVIVEGDGRRWHARMDQMAADRRRDREAMNHGWRCYRFVWEEITRNPEMVRQTIIEALA